MKNFAIEYRESGLNVLPTKQNKSPNMGSWQELQHRQIELKEILMNFKTAHGIALICGKISGGLEVLDFDNHQNDAKQRFNEFMKIDEVKEICEKHNLPIEKSQGGGYHLFYRCSKIKGSQKLAQKPIWSEKSNKWRPDAVIETKGEGGYLICYPTPNYKLLRGNLNLIEEITPEDRNILLNFAKTFNEWNNDRPTEFEENKKPGDVYNLDNNSISEAKTILRNNGWEELRNNLWRRPDKKDGVSATFGKVAPNVFYNFSANGYPFEEKKAYTPFQILAILEYNGDFKATAKYLADKYGLKNKPKIAKKEQTPKSETNILELENIFKTRIINKNSNIPAPIVFLSIRQNANLSKFNLSWQENKFVRFMTAGNISVITGKAKSKKTFIQSMLISSLIGDAYSNIFRSNIYKQNKPIVFSFDTEQSKFDTKRVFDRINKLSENATDNFLNFSLRGIEPKILVEFIEYSIKKILKIVEINDKIKESVSVVFIDQVADLTKSINSEEEAVEIVKKLEKLSNDYNLHICCNVHQNKNDNFASGWLGSQLMKKAETIIKITKDLTDNSISHVEPDLMRGEDFDSFSFQINSNGMPEIIEISEKIDTKPAF